MSEIPYILPYGIHVVGEYAPSAKNPYWRVRIHAHSLFDAKDNNGYQMVRKSRVVMTSVLGRKLLRSELVHHKNKGREDDSPGNLELISPDAHNKHHKAGVKHTLETKNKISKGLKLAIEEGRRVYPKILGRIGRPHTEESKQKMSDTHKKAIASGKRKKPVPPVLRGEDSCKSKLTKHDVLEIRKRAKSGESKVFLAKEFSVVQQTIYNIINRASWGHIL